MHQNCVTRIFPNAEKSVTSNPRCKQLSLYNRAGLHLINTPHIQQTKKRKRKTQLHKIFKISQWKWKLCLCYHLPKWAWSSLYIKALTECYSLKPAKTSSTSSSTFSAYPLGISLRSQTGHDAWLLRKYSRQHYKFKSSDLVAHAFRTELPPIQWSERSSVPGDGWSRAEIPIHSFYNNAVRRVSSQRRGSWGESSRYGQGWGIYIFVSSFITFCIRIMHYFFYNFCFSFFPFIINVNDFLTLKNY